MLRAKSALKLVVGLFSIGIVASTLFLVLALFLPFRGLRIRTCNIFGKVVGPYFLWLSGSKTTVNGGEHLNRKRPALYVSNHTSVMDIFIAMWLSPIGTVGIAKKEILKYPFFGQAYLLSGHLWIDRGRTDRSVSTLKKLAEFVRRKQLSIFLWPEGTRSRTGNLLPFKKGLVHLALQTQLPVVPIVVKGAHECWEKKTRVIRGVKIAISVLPPIDTSGWSLDRMEEAIEEVQSQFRRIVPSAA